MAAISKRRPIDKQMIDPATGRVTLEWDAFFSKIQSLIGTDAVQSVTASETTEIDLSSGPIINFDLAATVTSMTILNAPPVGKFGYAVFFITNAGDHSISAWPLGTKWPGGVSPVISTNNTVVLITPDHGTTWYGFVSSQNQTFGAMIKALTMIPASGDFCYSTTDVEFDIGDGTYVTMNSHSDDGYMGTDFSRSMDDLQTQAPNCSAVSLFVGWFGDDLRAGSCLLKPRVDSATTITRPKTWSVAGLARNQVPVVSQVSVDGGAIAPSYGSTPSDDSVLEGIADLKARGLQVAFTPFIFMDIPQDSTLPGPDGGTQPAYPWRGRIKVLGASDKTAAAATEISTFYLGTWGYRNFILHYANLCAAANGVDIFVIGSEMRGLTWSRSNSTTHPFVDHLVGLAAEVKAILPGAKIVYTADWSEWNSYSPGDGSGDLIFHLDPLWSSPNIDAIGIDNYMPLSDWRDVPENGATNLDGEQWATIYDYSYLMSRVNSGEGYDWYYADQAGRDAQIRLGIADGAYGKPWVYRYKDLVNWWTEKHYSRLAGVELGSSTDWLPQSKPIWIMECGCAAADKASNQPNVFVDPKSSESFLPYYSTGLQDDKMQRRHLESVMRHFDPNDSQFVAANNPVSNYYDGRMVDINRIFLYTWDARAYEVFPLRWDVWSDATNYPLGDWLTGRIDVPI